MEEPPVGDTTAEWPAPSQFGPYLLKRLLGRGGFGEVYEAVDTNKNRTVALKVLPPSISANPVFRTRLFREASTAGRLHEPHVVPIHDYGEIDGQLYIDMRLIEGTDLRTVLDETGPLDPGRAVGIIGQVASALDAAHAEQIVHRDVKPANILLTDEDFVCLVDFGLASAATDAKLTTAGAAVGTFAYMAPERFADEPIDQRADVYALACVLYECLTGASPYQASQPAAVIAAHLTSPIPRPSEQRPSIRPTFDDVVIRGMAKNLDDRYSSAGELAEAARRALAGARRRDDDTAPVGKAAVTAGASRPRASRRWIALLAGTMLLIVVAAAVIIQRVSGRHGESAPVVTKPGTSSIARIAATIPVGKRPEAVAVDAVTHTAYTANYGDGTLTVIDTASRAVTATIQVGNGPVGVAADSTTHTAYTANNRDDTISAIDTAKRAVSATVKVGTNPWGLAVDPTTHAAYVANMWDYSVSVIDIESHRVIATIPVGKNPYGVAVDPTTHAAYVANSSDGTLSVIDTTSLSVTATIPVGNDPRGVAVDATAHAAYITNESESSVSVVSLDSRRVIATIHIGNSPYGVAVDAAAHTVYTANHDSAVSVIDTNSFTVSSTIKIGKETFALAVDPATHVIYTANDDNTVSVIVPGLA